jgi:cystathionine beta-lyase
VGSEVERFLKPNTRIIYLESPGSNTFELSDVPAVTEVARSKEIVTVLDNTWATPLFFRPFEHGVDISIHSASKYISGNSDTLLGSVTTNEERFAEFEAFYETTEHFAAPECCYSGLKGLRSLGLRMARHQAAGLEIARWLQKHPSVETVVHPGLDSHPEHHIWRRDFTGASGVFGFLLKEDPSEAELSTFLDPMRFFAIGLSWGGFQSLIKASGVTDRVHPFRYRERTIIRVSIGVEDVESLQNDLAEGLDRIRRSG